MIQFLENKSIDKHKWDECVKQSPNAIMFVYSWYLDAVCPGWCALVEDDYEAVFPLALKSKLGVSYVYQPFFTRYFGLYPRKKNNDGLLNLFVDSIPEKVKYADFCLHEQNHLVKANGFSFSQKKFQVLDLHRTAPEIRAAYSENVNRNIKKALKCGYAVAESVSPDDMVSLFKKTKGRELQVFSNKNYKEMQHLMEHCLQRGKGTSIGVSDRSKKLQAAAFFAEDVNRFIFLKSAVSSEGKKNGAMHFLVNYFIECHAGKNCILDFGGSSVESVARFYNSFGAKEIVYLQIKKNNLPFPLRLLKK